MSYLICNNCEVYYEIEEDFNLDSLDTCEKCGNKLKLYKKFDDYYNENSEPQRESMSVGKGYAEKMSSQYNNMVIIGAIVGLIGIIGFIVTPLSIIILLIGTGLLFYGYNKGKSWNKGIKRESIVAEHLNQLPKDYFIFNDVKFPGSYGNLDHIVIGPNGIYVIETKNYSGFFIVRGKEWFYKSGKYTEKAHSQPGKQVMANAMSLRKFLIDNGVNMEGVWVNSIVTLLNNNFKIEQKPRHYNVLFPSTIPQFILNSNRNVDVDFLKEVAI
jgi:hypothetical protein